MGPPEADRKRLPTMSWQSVVDDAPPSPSAAPAPPADPPAAGVAPANVEAQGLAAAPEVEPPPIVFAPLALQVDADPDPAPDPAPAPASVPAVAAAPAPSAAPAPAASAPEPFTLPAIVEATPVPEAHGEDLAALAGDADGAPVLATVGAATGPELATGGAAVDAAPAVAAPSPAPVTGPRLPEVQQVAARPVVEEVAVAPVGAPPSARPRRRRSRRGPKLVLVLLVLGGLVAAAIVFGRPYLFPSDFDEATEPYAEAVQAARGVEFTDVVSVVSEPPETFATRRVDALGVDWERDAPVWRALGLLSGPTGADQVAETLDAWQSALYSTVDGNVYRDETVVGPQADAAVVEAVAAASIDQEFRWSPGLTARGLDIEVETFAEVERQGRSVLVDSSFAVVVDEPDPAPLVFLPPVLGFRALGPPTLAEFDRDDTTNPLATTDPAGPGPLVTAAPVAAPAPTPVAGDTLTGTATAVDAAFWYLVLGGYLDARTAHGASEAVVESSVTVADRSGQACVYGTFAGGDLDQTARLRAGLEQWAAAVPAELGAAVSVQPDGTLQLVTCDPGDGFVHPSRLGVARELVAWRVAELATYDYLTNASTGDAATGVRPDVDAAWAVVAASEVPLEVAGLPPDTPLEVIANTARVGVAAVLAPAG